MPNKNEGQGVDEIIQQETANRIEKMQSSDYKFPATITGVDVSIIVGSIIICILLIVLCMVGVIN